MERITRNSKSALSKSALHSGHNRVLGVYGRNDIWGPLGATFSELFFGTVAVVASSAVLTSVLKFMALLLASIAAVLLSTTALQGTPSPRDGLRLLRSVVSGRRGIDSVDVAGNVPFASHPDLLGWLIPSIMVICVTLVAVVVSWVGQGGSAWSGPRLRLGMKKAIAPGPLGYPVLGCAWVMQGNAHRKLAALAWKLHAQKLMAFSVGCTRVVITSDPAVAREMLLGAAFAERPLKEAAEKLLFAQAMGFAAPGPYWRRLRRIAATSLFSPRQIVAHEKVRQEETSRMLQAIIDAASCPAAATNRSIAVRSFLQRAAVNNMMRVVFGSRYEFGDSCTEAAELEGMIRDCFDVLGAFNWADHFPGMRCLDIFAVGNKCKALVPRVKAFVQRIINDHRAGTFQRLDSEKDFVDVLLGLEGEDKLSDSDMVSVLWEMIFRGTDTIAVLTEWALAEIVLHPEWQKKVQEELDSVVGPHCIVQDSHMDKLPTLNAVLKETLRVHPPGPLLSWARLATQDVKLGGFDVPRGTTAMVNMWAITHDPSLWSNPFDFNPQRFMGEGADFDVRGGDLRLAPFGAGRRVCPGRSLGLATSHLWLARLLHQMSWAQDAGRSVDLTEELKLSCEMANPLHAVPTPRVEFVC